MLHASISKAKSTPNYGYTITGGNVRAALKVFIASWSSKLSSMKMAARISSRADSAVLRFVQNWN